MIEFPFPETDYGEGKKPYISCKEALSDLDFIGDTMLLQEHDKYVLEAETDYQCFMRKDCDVLMNHVTISKLWLLKPEMKRNL